MIENKGFDITFQNGKALIMPRASILEKLFSFVVRERNLYRIKG
jgi:hypothetical protein